MTIAATLARQLARPSGLSGALLGRAMDFANRRPMQLALDALALRAGETVLDAGCGTGAAITAMLQRAPCKVTGADVSATMIAAARKRLGNRARLVLSRIDELPASEGPFDAVLALNVLYFEGEDHAMLRRLHAQMRPGGRLVAYVTHCASMEKWAFSRQGLHRLYDAEGLVQALADGGFAREGIAVHEVMVTRSIRGLIARANR